MLFRKDAPGPVDWLCKTSDALFSKTSEMLTFGVGCGGLWYLTGVFSFCGGAGEREHMNGELFPDVSC